MAKRGPKPRPKLTPKPVGRPVRKLAGTSDGMAMVIVSFVASELRAGRIGPIKKDSDALKFAIVFVSGGILLYPGSATLFATGLEEQYESDLRNARKRNTVRVNFAGRQAEISDTLRRIENKNGNPDDIAWMILSVGAIRQYLSSGPVDAHMMAEAVLCALGWDIYNILAAHKSENAKMARDYVRRSIKGLVSEIKQKRNEIGRN